MTLRYASEVEEPIGARRTDGIYSPIIYVTGVSSWSAAGAAPGTPVLGFVAGTTTRKVVLQACERDAFRERQKDGTQPTPKRSPGAAPNSWSARRGSGSGPRRGNSWPGSGAPTPR